MLCEPVLGNISLAISDNRVIIFAIERIIDFCHSVGIHCTFRGCSKIFETFL